MSMTRDSIFEEAKLKTEKVLLKGGEVIMSGVSGPDYIKLYTDPANQKETGEKILENGKEVPVTSIEMGRFQACLIAYGAVDEAGNRLFSDEDIPRIQRFNQDTFLKLAETARKLNGFGEELVKNSESDQIESPFSDSVSH